MGYRPYQCNNKSVCFGYGGCNDLFDNIFQLFYFTLYVLLIHRFKYYLWWLFLIPIKSTYDSQLFRLFLTQHNIFPKIKSSNTIIIISNRVFSVCFCSCFSLQTMIGVADNVKELVVRSMPSWKTILTARKEQSPEKVTVPRL